MLNRQIYLRRVVHNVTWECCQKCKFSDPISDLLNQKLSLEPGNLCFHKPFRLSQYILKLESYYSRPKYRHKRYDLPLPISLHQCQAAKSLRKEMRSQGSQVARSSDDQNMILYRDSLKDWFLTLMSGSTSLPLFVR